MLSLDLQNQWRERYRMAHPEWRPATEIFSERVKAWLRPDARLLDLGCGRGGLIEQLTHPLAQTIGVDPDSASLREHRLAALPRIAALSERLPFAPGSFDVVTASWLLEHLRYPASTIEAVGRVLQSGGVFIFITPNARHPLALANRIAGLLDRFQGHLVARIYGRGEGDTFPTRYRANTRQRLGDLASGAGMVLESIDFVPDPTYLAFNEAFYRAMCSLEDCLPADRRIHIVGVMHKPA